MAADGEVDAAAIEKSAIIQSAIAAGDSWPDNHLYVALLEVAAGRKPEAIAALERLQAAGYRDYLWLEVLPTFEALQEDPGFTRILEGMRADVGRQRAQVLTASWLPQELRETAPPPPEE